LKKRASRLGIGGRIRFLNERSDVARLMAAADIYCQPNTHPDSFGITFIEALYAELPVVTTSLGGACEILNDSCGVLVRPGDVSALAEALQRLIRDRTERHKLGRSGPKRARDLCDPEAQLTNYTNCLKGVYTRVVF
jgi:glycosyltransferase involved in cell wall biosynthesis